MGDFLVKEPTNTEIAKVEKVFREELFTISLLKKLMKPKIIQANDEVRDLVDFVKTLDSEQMFEPVIKAKQGLLVSLLFLKLLSKTELEMRLCMKRMNMELKEEILNICARSTATFKDTQCVKLELRSLLCEVELLW
jgi:hypothetical protein